MKKNVTIMFRRIFSLMLVCIVLAGMSVQAFADNSSSESKPVKIKVAFYPLDGFFYYDENGEEAGYGVDYLNELKKYANIDWEYVPVDSWEAIKDMLYSGEADVRMPVTAPVDMSTSYSSFTTEPVLPSYHAIMTLDNRKDLFYQDYDTFSTLKIGVTESLLDKVGIIDYLKSIGVYDNLIYFDDYNSCREALDKGSLDALISNVMDLTDDLKILDKFAVSYCYITTLKGNSNYRIINDAMTEMSLQNPTFQSNLFAKYFPNRANEPFTKEETEYIKNTDKLTVAVRTDRKPVSYYDEVNDSYKGIGIDIAEEISKNLGIKFEYIPITTDNPLDMLDTADLVMPVTSNGGNDDYFVTGSLMDSEIVFVVHEGEKVPETNLKIGVLESTYGIYNTLVKNGFTDIIKYKSNDAALKALQDGEIKAFANSTYVMNWALENPRYDNLRTLHYQSMPLEYKMAGKISDTHLQTILSKSISLISEDTKNQYIISETSFTMDDLSISDKLFAYRWEIITACVAFIILAAATLLYNHSRNKYIIEIEEKAANRKRQTTQKVISLPE